MEILEYFASERQAHWLEQIRKSDWDAGRFLYELLRDGRFRELTGAGSKVLLLTEGDELIAFCTYAEKDDIQPTELSPWVGFVYTFPAWRGQRMFGRLLAEAERLGRRDGFDALYISTSHTGLYEKYGCEFHDVMTDIEGGPSRVYRRRL